MINLYLNISILKCNMKLYYRKYLEYSPSLYLKQRESAQFVIVEYIRLILN